MAKKRNDRDRKTATPARPSPSPSRPAASSPSRSAAQSAANAAQARAFQEAKARSEQAQRNIYDARVAADRARDTLSRVPAAIKNPVVGTIAKIEATKPEPEKKPPQQIGRNRLRDAARKQARTHQLGALTDNKLARETRRSPEKVRAIIKCKSRPKTNKSTRRGGGGGGKRFIPWC